jgi:DNA polymerase I-like protein with 3'-5' exonuclease and polymerase domains
MHYDQWGKYNYINSMELIQKVDKMMITDGKQNYELVSIDTETNGLRHKIASVIGFSWSVDDQKGWYLPLVEWIPDESSLKTVTKNKKKYEAFMDGHFRCVWTGKTYPEFFKPHEYEMPEFIPALIIRWFKGTRDIYHNAPFDVNHLHEITGVDLCDEVFADTALLSHILNENSPNGLKETASEWKEELGINPHQMANQEQKELGESVIRNGGDVTPSGKPKTVWRAEPEFMCKYACSDTFLTYGVFKVGIQKFIQRFGEDMLDWFFTKEVMPLCREVVIPMKRKGVYIDVPHFQKAAKETAQKLLDLEDAVIESVKDHLPHFTIGKSLDEAISNQRLVKRIIEIEGKSIPTKLDKKTGKYKETLAKGVVKKVYQEDPHWIWGYILGEDEIAYSDEKLLAIKKQLYLEVEGRRYRFNPGSDNHLRWLFCDRLGYSKTDLPQTDSATKDNPIPSMAADVLTEFILPDHPWIANILKFKKLRKLHSGYMLPALNLNIDGWLYMDMRQNGTKSGRFACSGGFNLQTLPKIDAEMEAKEECPKCKSNNTAVHQEISALADVTCNDCGHVQVGVVCPSVIKKGFIAPPGFKIVNADYSSLEPRCFAFVSGDDKLKEVYWNGLDLYSKVYCDMYDDENQYSAHPDADNFLKKLNKAARTGVKPIVLGIPYGANKYQVAQLLDAYVEVKKDGKLVKFPDTARGQATIDQYLGTYKDLQKYMEKCEIDCLTKGYVETLIGRRRHFMYAPKIYRFLVTKRIKVEEIIEASSNQLKKHTTKFVSANGNMISLTEGELKALISDMGLPYKNCVNKGYWLYVKNLLKADLNNSKNHPIQGLAGHITNKGMLETTRLFKQNNIPLDVGWVCLQIHDEIMTYVREDMSQLGADCLQSGMEKNEFTALLDIDMIAEPEICDCVMEAK